MQIKLKVVVVPVLVGSVLMISGCGAGGGMSEKDVNALKHPEKDPMPQQAKDLMANPGSVKAAGAKYGTPVDK